MTEPRLLLPFLDMRLEVLPAILTLLRRVTARLVLALRAGGRGRPRERNGIAQGLAVCPPRLQARWTTTVLVPWMLWTSTGMTLSGLSWPSSGTSTTWKSRRVYHQFDARLLLHQSMGRCWRPLRHSTCLPLPRCGRFWATLIWLCSNFWRTKLCTVSCLCPVGGIEGTTVRPLPLFRDRIQSLLGLPLLP